MEVIDHAPYSWFLLRDGDALLLDARCSQGAFDGSVLIALDAAELAERDADGHDAVDRLATAVHMSAPFARGTDSPYRDRDLFRDGERGRELRREVHHAVLRFRAG